MSRNIETVDQSTQSDLDPNDTIVVDTREPEYDFGNKPGDTVMWFGTYKGHPFRKLAMGYKQLCLIQRENDPYSEDVRFCKPSYNLHSWL